MELGLGLSSLVQVNGALLSDEGEAHRRLKQRAPAWLIATPSAIEATPPNKTAKNKIKQSNSVSSPTIEAPRPTSLTDCFVSANNSPNDEQ